MASLKKATFSKPTYYLCSAEYAKIIGEINTNFGLYEGKSEAIHLSYGIDDVPYVYYFENRGYNCYNIYNRVVNTWDMH